MAIKKFNSVAGFSVGDTQISVIDAGANLTPANIAVTGSGNITGANVVIATTVLAANIGNAASVLFGDGANITGIPTQASIIDLFSNGTYTGNFVTTGGNITTGTGNVNGGNLVTGGVVAATGNVSGGNVTTGGQVVATGNVAGGNVTTGGQVVAVGNVSGGNLTTTGNVDGVSMNASGTIAATGNVSGGNLTTTGTVAAGVVSATGNVSGGNLTTGGEVVAVGNVSGGNLTTGGQVVATGNVSGGNLTTAGTVEGATVLAGTIGNAASALFGNGANISAITGANVTGEVNFAAVANSVAGGNVVGQVANAALADFATLAATANTVAGANVTGVVANANYAAFSGQVVDSAQANITSLGTLTTLVVSGNSQVQGNLISSEIVGNASGVTITATGTNQNITLVPTGTGTIAVSAKRITGLAEPTASTDAATKQYVDDVAQGLSVRAASQAATSADLGATYNNGAAGVGATLQIAGGLASIDGVTLVQGVGQRVLVKDQTALPENGIYVVTTQDPGVVTILTRAPDFDTPADMTGGAYTFVQNGTLYNNTGWVQIDPITTVGTSPVEFDQFSGAGTYTAGTGLTLNGTQFRITDTAVTAGTYGNASQTATFTVNAQGQLTAASEQAIVANAETLSGTSLNSTVVGSSLTSVGTLTSLAVTGNANVASNVNVTGNVLAGNVAATVAVSAQQLTATNLVAVQQSFIQSASIVTDSLVQTTLFVGTANKSYELLIKGNDLAGGAESVSKVLATTQGDYIVYGQATSGVSPGTIDVTATGNTITVKVTAATVADTLWICQAYAV